MPAGKAQGGIFVVLLLSFLVLLGVDIALFVISLAGHVGASIVSVVELLMCVLKSLDLKPSFPSQFEFRGNRGFVIVRVTLLVTTDVVGFPNAACFAILCPHRTGCLKRP